jgi:hypothetical protein
VSQHHCLPMCNLWAFPQHAGGRQTDLDLEPLFPCFKIPRVVNAQWHEHIGRGEGSCLQLMMNMSARVVKGLLNLLASMMGAACTHMVIHLWPAYHMGTLQLQVLRKLLLAAFPFLWLCLCHPGPGFAMSCCSTANGAAVTSRSDHANGKSRPPGEKKCSQYKQRTWPSKADTAACRWLLISARVDCPEFRDRSDADQRPASEKNP